MATPPLVCIAGAFAPPITGQTMATERLASLLESACAVGRVRLNAGGSDTVETSPGLSLNKIEGYLNGGLLLSKVLLRSPVDVLLWTSISPQISGHWRDRLTVAPFLRRASSTYGVIHWGDFERVFRNPATGWSARRLLDRLNGLVFLDESLAERCARWVPASQRLVIPNTIDDTLCFDDRTIAKKHAGRTGRERLRLLYLSNMIPSKGYLDVAEAARILHRRGIAFELRMAGRWIDDRDAASFQAFIQEAGLGDRVQHLGPVTDRKTVRELHHWADVLVFPTYYPTEAQPLVILEALSAGTPVVTTRHGGIPNMIREGVEGWFVPPGNPQSLADTLAEVVRDDVFWLDCARRARVRFLEAYSPKTVRARWMALIGSEVRRPAL